MKAIYQSERAAVYLGDARDVLGEIQTESVDLVIADPPYGVEWQSRRRSSSFGLMAGDDNDRAGVRESLVECVRVVGQNRHLYVFGPPEVLSGLKVTEPVELVWDKGVMGSGDLSAPWGPQHETISFLVSKHRHGGETGGTSVAARRRKGSVLRFGRRTGRTVRHPSEKPTDLLAELIESSSRIGELVLDPFGGSGSTAVAAILLGRRAIIAEIESRYVDLAVERIRTAEELRNRMEAT